MLGKHNVQDRLPVSAATWRRPVLVDDPPTTPPRRLRKASASRQPPRQNVVGPRIAAVRAALGLSQDALSARCTLLGWEVSENGITKIETQVRCVTDHELFVLARALRVKLIELIPPAERRKLF